MVTLEMENCLLCNNCKNGVSVKVARKYFTLISMSVHVRTFVYNMSIHAYMCVYVCVCVCERERERERESANVILHKTNLNA